MNKKYYWLKLKENFFEEDTISWLEEQENGKEYCLFYLKLCLKSLKTDGVLVRNVGELLIPYDVKKLGDMTNTDTDTVRVAMELFKQIGLIQILENGEIYLTQLENMVGSETSKAEPMRRLRAKRKEEGNNVTKMLPRDRDRERDKEIEKEYSCNYAERQWMRMLNGTEIQAFNDMDDEYGVEEVKKAIKISCLQNKCTASYVKGILNKQGKKPKWLDTDVKKEDPSKEDLDEMNEILKEFN